MNNLENVWKTSLLEAQEAIQKVNSNPENFSKLSEISEAMIATLKAGGKIFSCGNGGSHCDAMHFAEELTGRYRKNRHPLGALALGDSSHVTCVSNDYGFEHIFSRQLLGLARPGDMLLLMSTSGQSKNQILAVEAAKSIGVKTAALLGKTGGALKELADFHFIAPGASSDRIQEIHIKVIHILIETIERRLFPDHYE